MKDLVSKSEIAKPDKREADQLTEGDKAAHALAERMLFGAESRPEVGPPRIILGLDCTTSMGEYITERRITPEMARTIADALFAKSPDLRVQLWYFRGSGDDQSNQPRQLRASNKWYETPTELARAIAAIEHWPGWTQHCKLLRHVVEEAEKQAVQRVVIVTDAFETKTPRRPLGDDLVAAKLHAEHLRDLGVKIVYAYKGTITGGCPLDRAGLSAEQAFREIAEVNDGACFLLNQTTLAERFGEIATQAALAAKGDTAGAQLLLEHLQTIPFDMETNVVGAGTT